MKIGNYILTKKRLAVGVAGAILLLFVGFISSVTFSGAKENTTIHVYPSMTNDVLEDSLKSSLGNNVGGKVSTLLSIFCTDIKERGGAYVVAEGDSPLKIAMRIRGHKQNVIKFTFNNIRTKEEFARCASAKLMMSKDEVLAILNDSIVCAKYGKNPNTIISILQPDSYEFFWTACPELLLIRLNRSYKQFWNDSRKEKAKALGLSPDEVTTVASIVEEETAKKDERGKVARLYLNRLNHGMMLQADPTVKFAIGDFTIKRITKEMLTTDSPYNTYKFLGLPPGPIRLPEKSTIDAVLNAPQHDFTYMCAKEDFSGYHNFTTNYSEHLANAQRYQEALNLRGIK